MHIAPAPRLLHGVNPSNLQAKDMNINVKVHKQEWQEKICQQTYRNRNSKVTNEKLVFQGLSNLKLQTSRVNCKS